MHTLGVNLVLFINFELATVEKSSKKVTVSVADV